MIFGLFGRFFGFLRSVDRDRRATEPHVLDDLASHLLVEPDAGENLLTKVGFALGGKGRELVAHDSDSQLL